MNEYPWEGAPLLDKLNHLVSKKEEAAELRQEIADLEVSIAESMPKQRETFEGIGTVERLKSADRKEWDHDELRRRVSSYARNHREYDPETGEIEAEWEAVQRVMFQCISPPSWRVTALREIEVDCDEYCSKKPGKTTIKISK